MCGIFAYYGGSLNAADIVLSGLKKLEYRGYDSWGIAVINNHQINFKKDVGEIGSINKLNLPSSHLSLGHTRWATTGNVSKINAHPHFSTDNSFALVQNGIVENFEELKKDLIKKGFKFKSQTDTEVIVRLIESQSTKNLVEAIRLSFLQLKGRNTIAVIDVKNNRIIALRNGSPLIVGRNKKDFYLSSDTFSLSNFVSDFIDLDNFEMVIFDQKINFLNAQTGHQINKKFTKMIISNISSDKGHYPHYMIKEIMETPKVIDSIINTNKQDIFKLAITIKKSKNVYLIGSGTAGNAAAQIAFYLKQYANIPAISLVGADASGYFDLFSSNDLIIAPSQSGETSDVLEVLEVAKNKGVKITSLINMPGSMMTRLSDFKFYSNSGPEICVMSTKVFTAQIVWGYLVAKTVSGEYSKAIKNLKNLSKSVKKYLNNLQNITKIKNLASKLIKIHDIFILGKGQNWQIAKEGMVKLIEGTYKHTHAIPAGDLKHYAITLMEKGVYVLVLDSPIEKLTNTINEVKTRGATVINFSDEEPVLNLIKLQLLAYFMAVKLKNNVDKPRNIAKSVTVK